MNYSELKTVNNSVVRQKVPLSAHDEEYLDDEKLGSLNIQAVSLQIKH